MAKRKILKRAKRAIQLKAQQQLSREQINITDEANYIIQCAQKRDARLVTLGELVFFSTETGDAWLLDIEDNLALRLAHDGEKQTYTITETSNQFSIEWNRSYQISGSAFIVVDHSGKMTTILGYPTKEIMRATRRVRRKN